MNESKIRKKLAEKLDAEVVTSCDWGGHRRFKSRETGKWGYCTGDGTVVQTPRFNSATHFNSVMNTYNVVEDGHERYYDPDWSNSWSTEQYSGSRAF
jgi:hypothetical protein